MSGAVPRGGQQGSLRAFSGRQACPGNHRPDFRQSQCPAKVRTRGRVQGLGEPVWSICPGRFCRPVLPGVIEMTAPSAELPLLYAGQPAKEGWGGRPCPFCTGRKREAWGREASCPDHTAEPGSESWCQSALPGLEGAVGSHVPSADPESVPCNGLCAGH